MVQLRTYWVGKALGTLAVLVWFAGDIPDPVASPVLQGVALLRELWELFVSNSTKGKIAIIVLLIWPGISLAATDLLVGLIFGARWREGLVRGRAVPVRPAVLLRFERDLPSSAPRRSSPQEDLLLSRAR